LTDIFDMPGCARKIGRPGAVQHWLAGVLAVWCAGCGLADIERVQRELYAAQYLPGPQHDLPADYQLGAGDVVEIRFSDKPQWNGRYRLLPHGCVVLPEIGAVQLAGLTADQAAERIRDTVGEQAGLVFVAIVAFESQAVYVLGEVAGGNRALPYQGPETVAELLRRAGGLTLDADPTDIRIHRSFGRQGEEEVLHVNLLAVLWEKDWRQNVYIQPFDRVVVPRNPWACLRDCLPGFWRRVLSPTRD